MKEQVSSTTEEYLWLLFREGSENAFDLIYGKMFPVLFNYGYRLCQDEEQVKDCIQNIFVEIWQKRDQVKEVHSLKHYFLKIMRRKIFKELGKRNDSAKSDFINLVKKEEYPLDSSFPGMHDLDYSASSVNSNRVMEFVGKLSDRKKEAILLKFYENLTYTEISEVMGLRDPKYARQLVYRSLDELRKNLVQVHNVSLASHTLFVFLLLCLMT
ncbi:RNA polymerase sigma factor [Catalinimonas niigatensis]|uniref:RNA polymerase sigma factor n=1 Tax=Catalinimonas niigatensis TaxID=1397264 RepID=UPI002666720C|nr:sigma-70 family RNA polymerase sigma factor [Catalinimonas niigatensis]WPP50345.1 sigma-70 family RNA polymerase sigma factor [Catalinimonas niigatensis]